MLRLYSKFTAKRTISIMGKLFPENAEVMSEKSLVFMTSIWHPLDIQIKSKNIYFMYIQVRQSLNQLGLTNLFILVIA
jgi:hypothetical protein